MLKQLLIPMTCLALIACNSTPSNQTTSNNSLAQLQVTHSPYSLNRAFQQAVTQKGAKGFAGYLNASALQAYYKTLAPNSKRSDAQLGKTFVVFLNNLIKTGELDYYTTTELNENLWRSHYRLFAADDSTLYVTLTWVDGKYLVDAKSESFADSTMEYYASTDGLAKLPKEEDAKLGKIVTHLSNKAFTQAAAEFNNLTETSKQNQVLLNTLIRLTITHVESGADVFLDALAVYLPKDTYLGLGWYNYLRKKEDNQGALKQLAGIAKEVQQDMYMLTERADLNTQLGNYEAAWQDMHQLLYRGSDNPISYAVAAQLAINMKHYQEAVELLDVLEQKFSFKLAESDIKDLDNSSDFLASDAYKAWRL
jgi:thioredoxin-like negative regulator of GroEL